MVRGTNMTLRGFITLSFWVLFLAGCDSNTVSSTEKKEQAKLAKLLQISTSNDERYLNYPAMVKSQSVSSLSFAVGGVVKDVVVVESQRVEKGDVLAVLDTRDLQENLKSAQAEFDIANSEFKRTERLVQSGAISKNEFEQRRSKRDISKAGLMSAKKAIQDATLNAPFSGHIAELSIRPNQAIQATEQAIVMIGLDGFEAEVNLPASIIAFAERNTQDRPTSYVTFSFAPEQKFSAQFKEASLNADTNSQTYRVVFTFDTPTQFNVLPGMTAKLWFKNPKRHQNDQGKVRIPISAIGVNGVQKYVWVVDPVSMVVSQRNVAIADSIGETLVVNEGLKDGETIVVSGIASLSKGMKVRAWIQE